MRHAQVHFNSIVYSSIHVEKTSWECGTFYVEPTDIITQLIHRLNGWIHIDATLLRMLSLLRRTRIYYDNSTIIMSSLHWSYYGPDQFSTSWTGNPRIRPPGLRNLPGTIPTDPAGLPLAVPELCCYLSRKGGYPRTRGTVTPPSDLPETSASPTGASVAVTGRFHYSQITATRPRRTLPDSVGFPTGLPSGQIRHFQNVPLWPRIH